MCSRATRKGGPHPKGSSMRAPAPFLFLFGLRFVVYLLLATRPRAKVNSQPNTPNPHFPRRGSTNILQQPRFAIGPLGFERSGAVKASDVWLLAFSDLTCTKRNGAQLHITTHTTPQREESPLCSQLRAELQQTRSHSVMTASTRCELLSRSTQSGATAMIMSLRLCSLALRSA